MKSGNNNCNYFSENQLTKLANLMQFKHVIMFCLGIRGAWAPYSPYATGWQAYLSDLMSSVT